MLINIYMNNKNDYINNLSIEYLINPNQLEKIYSKNGDNNISSQIEFYSRRINNITKEMIKGKYQSEGVKQVFLQYVSSLIYHFKNVDKKDFIQEQYNSLNSEDDIMCSKNKIDETNDLLGENEVIISKKEKKYNLDKFVKIKNPLQSKEIIPDLKVYDLTSPELKNKGVKVKKKKLQNKVVIK